MLIVQLSEWGNAQMLIVEVSGGKAQILIVEVSGGMRKC